MWVVDAFRYIVSGLDDRAMLAPSLLLIFAWHRWVHSARVVASFRAVSLFGALVCGTITVSVHASLIVWSRVIHPWVRPDSAYCANSWWGDPVAFFGTAGSFLLSLVARGPGKALALLSATLLVVLRVCMW
jgi:hypothetical protein